MSCKASTFQALKSLLFNNKMNISSRKLLNIIFPVILILMVMMGVFSYNNNETFEKTSGQIKRSYRLLSKIDNVSVLVMEIENEKNSYFFTGNSTNTLIVKAKEIDKEIDSLKLLTVNSSIQKAQEARFDSLSSLVNDLISGPKQIKDSNFDNDSDDVGIFLITYNHDTRNKINVLLSEILNNANIVLHEREAANNQTVNTFHWIFYSILICLFALLIIVLWLIVHIFKRQEREKENAEHALAREKELNEMKSRFVSFASHEFRTPLTTILSSASLIERYQADKLDEGSSKHITRIKLNVKSLIDLLNDFLSIGKLEEGKIENYPKEVNIEEFTDDLITGLKEMTKEGQQIITEIKGKHEPVFVDDRLLKNVLNNLISNAIKYSPVNSAINFKVVPNNTHVSFIVQDHGIGIPEKDQKHLFETFFRATNATQTPGTGLGLCIVKRYLKIMGGTIAFTSKENEGTIFEIQIPKKASLSL